MTASDLAQGTTYHVDAGAEVEQVMHMMEEHQIRRVPVLEEHRLVGMISEADIARHLPENAVGSFVEAICAPTVRPSS
ncbi:Hypoxic response protein 1 [Gordonia sp. YY1]|nr:Hypoxic response protein 1 [Gordonia sp. YY1]